MRRTIPLLAVALAGCTAPVRAPGGGGIVSTNPCADAILIELVPPARIAAISHYSQDPAATSIPIEVARRFRSTAGTAEEVIALDPDLVLTSSFTPPGTRNAYARAGLKTLLLDSPTTIAASKTQIAEVAQAVGAAERGRALVARIDRAVGAAVPQSADRPGALLFIAGNLVNGSGTLLDELLNRAGFRNAAADYGLAFTGTLPIETIAAHPPRVILAPDVSRTAQLRRRVLAETRARVTEAAFPRNLVNCGGPTIIPAMGRLAEIRRSLESKRSDSRIFSLSQREREGARAEGVGRVRVSVERVPPIALTLPPLRGSLPLPLGEGNQGAGRSVAPIAAHQPA